MIISEGLLKRLRIVPAVTLSTKSRFERCNHLYRPMACNRVY